MIDYNIISTGSQGNAVVFNKHIMIDCGVSFKDLSPVYRNLKLILLTHIHSDHFNKPTIKRLAEERPCLRFACGRWLISPLVSLGVKKSNIDVLDFDLNYNYGICNVIPVRLFHNVPNMGFKIFFKNDKLFYATDTNSLSGIQAKGYDLYMVEANYEDSEIKERIAHKKEEGIYPYELNVLKNHLSKAKADEFIYANADMHSKYIYMHGHKEKGGNKHKNEI